MFYCTLSHVQKSGGQYRGCGHNLGIAHRKLAKVGHFGQSGHFGQKKKKPCNVEILTLVLVNFEFFFYRQDQVWSTPPLRSDITTRPQSSSTT